MVCLVPVQGLVGPMGRQLLLNGVEYGSVQDRRVLFGQDLALVFDFADEEARFRRK